MPKASPNARLIKRLLPLYIAVFLQGFVLWYMVEKLFMQQIGFDNAGIGIMVAAYSALMLFVETPSGILADRWSRKGVLILAGIALAASSIVCGLSESIPMYLAGAGLWGLFFALHSGTHDSIVYDTLLEEEGNTKKYEQYYGRVKIADSAALVLGSLLGGVVATELGLRATYYLTVPLALASIIALLVFREPKLHKQQVAEPILRHVRDTFSAILQKGQLVFVIVATVILSMLSYALFEFGQLWWIALAMPVIAFGPSNAALLATIGLGGWVAGRFGLHRQAVMYSTFVVMVLSTLGLVVSRSNLITVVCQVVLCTGLIGLGVVFNRMLHDSLESRVRAGASSAVSTFMRVFLILFSISFGFISKEMGVFVASWLFVLMLVICLAVVIRMFAHRKLTTITISLDDGLSAETYQK